MSSVEKYHYIVTSKTKSIYKLICAWSNMQGNKRLSVIIACKYAMKVLGDGDILSNITDDTDEKILSSLREFIADTCTVSFDFNNVQKSLDLLFYKSDKTGVYDWLSNQLSVTQSISFAIYLLIKTYGMEDAFDIFMSKIDDIIDKEVASE